MVVLFFLLFFTGCTQGHLFACYKQHLLKGLKDHQEGSQQQTTIVFFDPTHRTQILLRKNASALEKKFLVADFWNDVPQKEIQHFVLGNSREENLNLDRFLLKAIPLENRLYEFMINEGIFPNENNPTEFEYQPQDLHYIVYTYIALNILIVEAYDHLCISHASSFEDSKTDQLVKPEINSILNNLEYLLRNYISLLENPEFQLPYKNELLEFYKREYTWLEDNYS